MTSWLLELGSHEFSRDIGKTYGVYKNGSFRRKAKIVAVVVVVVGIYELGRRGFSLFFHERGIARILWDHV